MQNLILGFDHLMVRLSNLSVGVAVFFLAVMAVLGTIDVLGLNLFGAPVQSATEGAAAMLAVSVALALSHVQRTRSHITVDIISRCFPTWLAVPVFCFSLLISLAVLFLISWGAWELAAHSYTIGERAVAAIRFPVWPVKILFALGCSFCALEMLRELVWVIVTGNTSVDARD